jgi:hypothetical protein
LVVLARTAANEVRGLEAVARRVPAPELVQLIEDLDRRWRPEAILFESNAAFAGVRDLLQRQLSPVFPNCPRFLPVFSSGFSFFPNL